MADHYEDFRLSQIEISNQMLIWERQAARCAEIMNVLGRMRFRGMSSNYFVEVMAAHEDLINMYSQRAREASAVAAKIRWTLADLGTVYKRLEDEEAARIEALTRRLRPGTPTKRP